MSDRAKILIVDDHPENIKLIETYFRREPYEVTGAANGIEALEKIKADPPDLILLDLMMPRMDGFLVSQQLKNDPQTRLIPIIMMTAFAKSENKIRGIEIGVDDFITKPINFIELQTRVKSLLRLKSYTDELEQAEKVIFSLARAVEAKDQYTMGHCQRLVHFSILLGEKLGLTEPDIITIRRGACLHDIGKIAVNETILLKSGPLSEDEFEQVKQHPMVGERICQPLRTLRSALPVIRHHHERYNGAGYPDALRGDKIPLPAQIVGIVDCYDALTSHRPYRESVPVEDALLILGNEVDDGLWHKDIYKAFKEIAIKHQDDEIQDINSW